MFAKNSWVKKEAKQRKFTLLKSSNVTKNVDEEKLEVEEVHSIKYNYDGDFSGKDKTIKWLQKHGFMQSEANRTSSESQNLYVIHSIFVNKSFLLKKDSQIETVSEERSQKLPKKDVMSDLKDKYPSLKKIGGKDDLKKPDVQIARLVTKIGRSISDTQHEVSSLAKQNKIHGVNRTYKDIMESISSIKASIKSTGEPILSTPPSLRKSKDFIAHKTSSINKRLTVSAI